MALVLYCVCQHAFLWICSINAQCTSFLAHDKMRSGADLNGDNLCIFRAYLQISDYCRVTVRLWVRCRVVDCCIPTNCWRKWQMQISHVIKTDHRQFAPRLPHSAFYHVSFLLYVLKEHRSCEIDDKWVKRNVYVIYCCCCWK